MTTSDSVRPLTAAQTERVIDGLRSAFIRLVAEALPSEDEHGNLASDVAEGMADHFEDAFRRALDEARAGYLDALRDIAENMNHTPHDGGRYDWCGPCRAAAALREAQP